MTPSTAPTVSLHRPSPLLSHHLPWFYLYLCCHEPTIVFNLTLNNQTVLCILAIIIVIALVFTRVGLKDNVVAAMAM
ncbi:hypothetical protein VNO80_19300 [Phaseolus coccineus]|uniref:Uncharacterized protein n=1 Tax=Phaseolus coccineus TaxID=3886 RepID=A0AAN9MG67_PHACN